MQTLVEQPQQMRELTAAELEAVGGAWSIGSSGDGGLSFDIGGYSGTIWTDGAALQNNATGVTRFFRW